MPKGRITCILGPSGTGKSVLLKNIIGLLTGTRQFGSQAHGAESRRQWQVDDIETLNFDSTASAQGGSQPGSPTPTTPTTTGK